MKLLNVIILFVFVVGAALGQEPTSNQKPKPSTPKSAPPMKPSAASAPSSCRKMDW